MDIGSSIYISICEVDSEYTLTIPFAGDDAQLGVTGETLLEALQPIKNKQSEAQYGNWKRENKRGGSHSGSCLLLLSLNE